MTEEQKRMERMRTLFVSGQELHDGFKAFLESIGADQDDQRNVLFSTYDEKKMFEARALVKYQGQLIDRVESLMRQNEPESEGETSRDTGPRVY